MRLKSINVAVRGIWCCKNFGVSVYALLMYNMWVCANVELAQFRWDGEPVIAQIAFLETLMMTMFKIRPEPEPPP